MSDDTKLAIINKSFKTLEDALNATGLSLVRGGEDTIDDGLLYVYNGDRFVGSIQTSAFNIPVSAT